MKGGKGEISDKISSGIEHPRKASEAMVKKYAEDGDGERGRSKNRGGRGAANKCGDKGAT